jgi:hypothetical protein
LIRSSLAFSAALLLGCSSDGLSPAPAPAPSRAHVPDEVYSGDDGRVFYPERTVACDRATRICYSGGEPSLAATERYLGEDAARRLRQREIDAQREPKWVFEPDGQTSCDMRTQVCYGAKGPSVNKTRKYFGDAAAVRLEQSMSGADPSVTRPKKKVGCDASVQICYDENGPSVKLTKKYFGEAAAKKLKKQIPH